MAPRPPVTAEKALSKRKKTTKKLDTDFFQEDSAKHNFDKCSQCLPARCCSYVSMQLDNPETLEDYENLLWYVAHQKVELYIMDGDWFMNINNRCSFLGDDNRCMAYDKRPSICRDYSVDNCEFEATYEEYGYDFYFETFEQLELYVWKKFGKRFVKDAPMPVGLKLPKAKLKKNVTKR